MARGKPLQRGTKATLRRSWMPRKSRRRREGGEAWWSAQRRRALERDGGLCLYHLVVLEAEVEATDVDHIVNLGSGGSRYDRTNRLNHLGNLQSLCRQCHDAKTTGRWIGRARSLRGSRPYWEPQAR